MKIVFFPFFDRIRLRDASEAVAALKAVYTAYVAPRRTKSKSVTYGWTGERTDTRFYQKSCFVAIIGGQTRCLDFSRNCEKKSSFRWCVCLFWLNWSAHWAVKSPLRRRVKWLYENVILWDSSWLILASTCWKLYTWNRQIDGLTDARIGRPIEMRHVSHSHNSVTPPIYQARWRQEKPTGGAGQNNNHWSKTSSTQHNLTSSQHQIGIETTSVQKCWRHSRYADIILNTPLSFLIRWRHSQYANAIYDAPMSFWNFATEDTWNIL